MIGRADPSGAKAERRRSTALNHHAALPWALVFVRGRFDRLWMVALPIGYIALLELVAAPARGGFWIVDRLEGAEGASLSMRVGLALLAIGTAVVAAGITLFLTRNVGKNDVYGTTVGEAATPISTAGRGTALPTRLVSDRELAAMASTAFVPPKGVSPWQGQVLLREAIDNRTTDAFVASLVFDDVLRIDSAVPGTRVIARGSHFVDADDWVRQWVDEALGPDERVELGRFNIEYATAMAKLGQTLKREIDATGWWKHGSGPSVVKSTKMGDRGPSSSCWFRAFLTKFAVIWLTLITLLLVRTPLLLVIYTGVISSLGVGLIQLRRWPSRTAEGSALALQVESFRRFLEKSETARTEHAWTRDTILEYGAWAIAIDEAEALVPELARTEIARLRDLPQIVRSLPSMPLTVTDID